MEAQKGVDIYSHDFPWRNGKPDWNTYHWSKVDERRAKRGPYKLNGQALSKHCHFVTTPSGLGTDALCWKKAAGNHEFVLNGITRQIPLCSEHAASSVITPTNQIVFCMKQKVIRETDKGFFVEDENETVLTPPLSLKQAIDYCGDDYTFIPISREDLRP